MKELFKFKTMHLVFPTIIGCILLILGIALIIQRYRLCKKEGKPFINLKDYHFFEPGYDKLKLFGSLVLFIGYIACLVPMGFLWASILFVFLFNVLFAESINFKVLFGKAEGAVVNVKSLLISAAVAVIASTFIWWLFGIVFNITLP